MVSRKFKRVSSSIISIPKNVAVGILGSVKRGVEKFSDEFTSPQMRDAVKCCQDQ